VGCVATVDREGRTIFVADAHRDNGKRFVVRADEKATAFLELERAIWRLRRIFLTIGRDFSQTQRHLTDLNQAEDFPR
jgi:hypothetical protein